ncbi:PTS lactose/cellobiose transporter subunit IIA [Vibrio sp. SS-MA-C1-2]|uniref:PTS lactose/cellobiose transporter subunit IIA n=1 Tax=Vibrio sp. SS-MA-C1-2 TaxID=2908646 RepID=UPI001F41923E|nr:PTS lactose/cellobiose transporter subunit IIA [Vibrio sp. SS-MA-C1-2]UJF18130.1 PTS lactose/cellobiose transporter subunit IIA [Vibrio sp. SS-MA-C1-2]
MDIKNNQDINEEFLMTLLCLVGEARSLIMEAMRKARVGDIINAKADLHAADDLLANVHKTQTSLIGFDQGEGKVKMTLILTHIQDHIMTAMLCRDIADEIVFIHQNRCQALL